MLYDSVNIRYASDTSYMPVFGMHFMGRHVFVPQAGPVILFEKPHMSHLWWDAPLIDELRPAIGWRSVFAGPDVAGNVRRWATEIADLVREHGGGNRRLAIDCCEPPAAFALRDLGIDLVDAQEPLERARAIKSTDEVNCMQVAMEVAGIGMRQMQDQLRPGLTENQLWSILGQVNLAYGGEWLECRLLTSGQRTNPWLQEANDKIIEAGRTGGVRHGHGGSLRLLRRRVAHLSVPGYAADCRSTEAVSSRSRGVAPQHGPHAAGVDPA